MQRAASPGFAGGLRRSMLAALCCALLGCATIVAGGPDEVPIKTTPAGAYVYLDGKVVGQTPIVITLDREKSLGDIRIYYPGFQPVVFNRYKNFNWWTVGNFFLAIFPVIVDVVTGNYMRFEDDEITISLTPGQSPPPYGIEPRGPQAPTFGAPPMQGPPPQYGPPPTMPPPREPRPPQPN